MWATWIWSLGQENPLEKGMTTHSSILAWSIPWTAEPGGLLSMGLQRIGHDWMTFTFTFKPRTWVVKYVESSLFFFFFFFWDVIKLCFWWVLGSSNWRKQELAGVKGKEENSLGLMSTWFGQKIEQKDQLAWCYETASFVLILRFQFWGCSRKRRGDGPPALAFSLVLFLSCCTWAHGSIYMLSRVQLFVTPWTVACQAPLSMQEFSKPEY